MLPWVQALRAFAAFSVAFVHIAHDAVDNGADPAGWFAALIRAMPWDAGVDVFFVISGFVIVHASAPLFGRPGGTLMFLRRRLTRIVPLYWLATSAFLVILLLSRAAIHGAIGGPAYLIASYLFIPWPRPNGVMQPAYGLGWTLNYEMFFYVALAPFLLLPRRYAVPTAGTCLVALAWFGQLVGFADPQLSYWSSPLILEFCAGMALAQAFAAGLRLPGQARLGLVVLALVALHVFGHAVPMFRPLAFGLPAVLLVAAATLAAPPGRAVWHHNPLVRLGDASYAMYLVHPFVMRALILIWRRFHAQTELAGLVYVLAGLALAQAAALAINAGFEKKLAAALRRPVTRPGSLKNEAV